MGVISSGYFVSHNMIHVLAIGAIGGLILAMITRVTMGHTGHNIYEGPSMWHAFLAILIAALVRGIGVAFSARIHDDTHQPFRHIMDLCVYNVYR